MHLGFAFGFYKSEVQLLFRGISPNYCQQRLTAGILRVDVKLQVKLLAEGNAGNILVAQGGILF